MTSTQQVQLLNVLPLSTVFVAATAPFVDSVSASLSAAALQYEPLWQLPSSWFALLLLSCCLGLAVNWSCFEIVLSISALSYVPPPFPLPSQTRHVTFRAGTRCCPTPRLSFYSP